MRNYRSFLLSLFLLAFVQSSYADKYPRNYAVDIIHYAFELKLSDQTDEIFGKASITVLFKKNDVKQIRLDLINRTEKRKAKGMVIESITIDAGKVSFTHTNDEVLIQLPSAPAEGKEIVFVIVYHGIPETGLIIGPTKYGNRSFFGDNWPNKARHWLPTVDHPYEKSTSEFIVKAPAHYKVISNGLLREESNLDSLTKLTHWKQSVPVSCWLFVLGVAEFAVQYVDDFHGKSIESWVYPKNREAGFYDFAEPTKQVLQFFTDYVGPYMYEKLANIQAASIGGGMETSSAVFYGENLINGKRDKRIRNVVIHELAHQWFGNAVTESTWDDAWLSEGFATFFTLLFIENAYGYDEYISDLQGAKRSIYKYAEKDSTFSIVKPRSAETDEVTSTITYQKGAWVLHMLRELIGKEKFKAGIQAYYKKLTNANATTEDFVIEMEKVYGKDLSPFFDQWLNKPDNLKLKGTAKYDDQKKQLVIELEQMQPGYVFHVPLEIGVFKTGSEKPVISKFQLNKKQATYTIKMSAAPAKIIIDPGTKLLAMVEFVY
jgi:aminopeptidase N